MTDDIVERLRYCGQSVYGPITLVNDAADEIERLRARLAEAEADNARLVAANKARDEFLRGHRYKHSEVDGYIDLCESQMADLKARLAEAVALLWNVRPYVYGLDRIKAIDAFLGPADSADAARCRTCGGSGAVDAPSSADDPSCPDCDGEGYITSCEYCGRAVGFDGMWHAPDCPTVNHPIQKPCPPMAGSGDGEGNAIDP